MIIKATITLTLYLIISALTYMAAKHDYNRREKKHTKLTIATIIIISLLFVSLNALVTNLSDGYGDDRTNYLLNYTGQRPTSSVGLQFIIDGCRKVNTDFNLLLFFTTFITTVFALISYRKNNESIPKALIFLLSTQFIFASFVNLKQCYANVLGVLGITYLLQDKTVKNTIVCFILITAATIFHPSAFFLFIVAIMVRVRKSRNQIVFLLGLLILAIFSFRPLLSLASMATQPIAPSLSQKIIQYTTEMDNDSIENTNIASLIKGIPFYIIFCVGWLKRKDLSKHIKNYDNYLLLTMLLSSTYIIGIYNIWFTRLAYFFYLPVSIYSAQIFTKLKGKNKHKMLLNISLFFNIILLSRYVFLIFINYGGM